MIDRQLGWPRLGAAILAGELISLVQVATAERDGLFGDTIEPTQYDNFGNTQDETTRANHFRATPGLQCGPITPIVKLQVVRIHKPSCLVPDLYKGTSHRGNVDGLPIAVQY
jgi:hypothetical protein